MPTPGVPRSCFKNSAQAVFLEVGIRTPLIETALRHLEKKIRDLLKEYLDNQGSIKYALRAYLDFTKYEYAEGGQPSVDSDTHVVARLTPHVMTNIREFPAQFLETIDALHTACQLFTDEGSGFHIERIKGVDVNIWRARTTEMGDYIPTPLSLLNSSKRYHMINVKTSTNCLKYSILAATIGRNFKSTAAECTETYDMTGADKDFDFSRVSAKSTIVDVENFEADNPNVAINIYTLKVKGSETNFVDTEEVDEDNDNDSDQEEEILNKEFHRSVDVLRCSPKLIKREKGEDSSGDVNLTVLNLLLLYKSDEADNDQYHLTAITNFHQFFKRKNERNEVRVCFRCLQQFTGPKKDANWRTHQEACWRQNPDNLALKLPEPGSDAAILQFTKTHLQHFSPFVAYIDLEAAMVSEAFVREQKKRKEKEARAASKTVDREARLSGRLRTSDQASSDDDDDKALERQKLDKFLCLNNYDSPVTEKTDEKEEVQPSPNDLSDVSRFQNRKGRCRDYTDKTWWPGDDAKQHHLMAWSCHIKAPPEFQHKFKAKTFVGDDEGRGLMSYLKQAKRTIDYILEHQTHKRPPQLTASQEVIFADKTVPCHICQKPITCTLSVEEYKKNISNLEGYDQLGPVVRDHCHFSGAIRGKAHYKCNMAYRLPSVYRLPVFAHNLASYDVSHREMPSFFSFFLCILLSARASLCCKCWLPRK